YVRAYLRSYFGAHPRGTTPRGHPAQPTVPSACPGPVICATCRGHTHSGPHSAAGGHRWEGTRPAIHARTCEHARVGYASVEHAPAGAYVRANCYATPRAACATCAGCGIHSQAG